MLPRWSIAVHGRTAAVNAATPAKIEWAVAQRCNQHLTYQRIAERVDLSRSAVVRACPGDLLHMDTKKLDRFDKPGHHGTGDRTENTLRAGSQALQMATDDHSRLGFSLLLADERATSACAFLLAALRYYKALG